VTESTTVLDSSDAAAEIVVQRVSDALFEIVRVIASVSPMFEMHRGMPPARTPRNSEEALELLRASAVAGQQLRAELAAAQTRWAQHAVLHGGRVKEVAEALVVSSGAISKRWPTLGALRPSHLWFLDSINVGLWVSACLAVAGESDSLVVISDDPDSLPASHLSDLVRLCRAYTESTPSSEDAASTPQWLELVHRSPGIVESLLDPRIVKATTELAAQALVGLRLVWRAYRAGISVQDQTERDREHRAQP
jgi:hypothetical protein